MRAKVSDEKTAGLTGYILKGETAHFANLQTGDFDEKKIAALAVLMACGGAGANLSLMALDPWEGEWKNTNGDRIVIYRSDNVLEVFGSDAASSYRLVCIVMAKGKAAQCVGDGIGQNDKPYRFIYNNKMQVQNGTISEQWEITSEGGTAKGEGLFKPASNKTR